MVADALVYHPAVTHYLKYQSTLIGRDKLLRLLQYFSRFYAWYLLRTNAPDRRIAPVAALKKQAGLVRKVIRVGKFLDHLKAASLAADTPAASSASAALVRYATVGRQLGYTGFLACDSLTVPNALALTKWAGAGSAQRAAWKFWTFGLLCSLAAQLCSLRQLRQREAKLDRKDGEGVVEGKRIAKERAVSKLQLVSDLCDLTIPTSGLGWANLDDGVVGLAGTVSSLIGIYAQWLKTA